MHKLVTLAVGMVVGLGSVATLVAQTPPPAQSVAAAKDVVDLMTKAKKDCVVTEHNAVFGGYVAALLIPGAKLTVVTARFKDTTSMTYKMYQKDCMGAYEDLTSAVDGMDRVIVDDIAGDGLIAMPKKDVPRDTITRDGKTMKFDGDKNALKQAKMTADDFNKAFTAADETYAQLLLLLSKELKK
jgi:hypothetical protein